jgi:hypothetical protein
VPSPWARLHLSRPFQSGPPSFAISVPLLLLLRTMGASEMSRERRSLQARSVAGEGIIAARWISLRLLWGVVCGSGGGRPGGSPASVVASC